MINMSIQQMKTYLIDMNNIEKNQPVGGNSPYGNASRIELYRMIVQHDLDIYSKLNYLTFNAGQVLYGFAWSKYNATELRKILDQQENIFHELQVHDVVDHNYDPPTYFRTNEFIGSFQKIVDTYGVPSYKEINPAPFYMVSFPFLFGVMFGDIGHGGILFAVGLSLIFFSDHDFMKTQ